MSWSWTDYEHLLACYRSGQISERQWQEHLRDKDFRDWAQKRREGPMPDRVIMVRESEWREMREALESAHKYVVASDHPASDRDLKHIEAVLAHPTPDGCGREGKHQWGGPEPQAETRTYYYPMYAGGWTGSERYDSLADAQAEEAHHLGSLVVAFLRVTCINDRPVAVALEDADG